MFKDELGTRMKKYYEEVPKTKLMRRTPVIIRIDGKTFHSFTKKFQKPFDELLIKTMQETTKYLCENIQGCVFGYTQSDEISLLLVQTKEESQPWFDNNIQKIVSVSASMATLYFNKNFEKRVFELMENYAKDKSDYTEEELKYVDKLDSKIYTAMFDSRVFVLPKEEVNNYFIWRQIDCTRNSILSLAQSLYSDKEIHGIKCDALQDKMFTEKNVNWNDLSTVKKRGTCAIRKEVEVNGVARNKWFIDEDIPIFTQDKTYINGIIYKGEE